MSNSTRHKLRSAVAAVFVSLALSACGAHYGAARFVSDPPGAEVINLDDDTVIGVTPITMFWKNGSDTRQHIPIRLKKPGYYDKVSSFWLSMRHNSEQAALDNAQVVEVIMLKRDG